MGRGSLAARLDGHCGAEVEDGPAGALLALRQRVRVRERERERERERGEERGERRENGRDR